jgi:hypothetical protein
VCHDLHSYAQLDRSAILLLDCRLYFINCTVERVHRMPAFPI